MIVVAVVAGMGLIGSAMALWGDTLCINEDVDTGYVDIDFTASSGFKVSGSSGDCCGSGGIDTEITDNDNTLVVDVDKGWLWSVWQTDFTITNNGTIPVKLEDSTFSMKNTDVYEYLVEPQDGTVIDPGASVTGSVQVEIKALKSKDRTFDGYIKFVPWNDGSTSNWSETLHIDGDMNY